MGCFSEASMQSGRNTTTEKSGLLFLGLEQKIAVVGRPPCPRTNHLTNPCSPLLNQTVLAAAFLLHALIGLPLSEATASQAEWPCPLWRGGATGLRRNRLQKKGSTGSTQQRRFHRSKVEWLWISRMSISLDRPRSLVDLHHCCACARRR
jgi:hypothetical protein